MTAKRIILADDSEDVRDLFSMMIQSLIKADIKECPSAVEAIELLKKDKAYDLIVSDLNMPGGNGDEIYIYLKENNLKIPFVLVTGMDKLDEYPALGQFTTENTCNSKLDKPPSSDDFKLAINKALGTSDTEEFNLEEYVPINVKNFKRINSSPVDVYLKLSDRKFVKIFNQQGLYSSKEIERYEAKKIHFLYIKGTDYQLFSQEIMRLMTKTLQLSEQATIEELTEAHKDTFELIQTNLQKIGISEAVLDATQASVTASLKMLESNDDLAKLLKLSQASGGYIYKHSLMLSFVATAIADKLEWRSKEIRTKLSLASLMHDITIVEDLESVKLFDQHPEAREKCTPKAKRNYEHHPQDAAKLVEKLKDYPHNVAQIILQHHETPNGQGFPRGLSSSHIAPLSCLFIVAHEFVNLMIDTDFSVSRRDNAIIAISNTHNKGNFEDAVKGLVKLFN